MEASQRWWLVGCQLREPIATDPLAAARLASGNARLVGVEVGFDVQLEPNGCGLKAQAVEPGAQRREFRHPDTG